MSMFWGHQEQTIAQGLGTQVGLDLSDPGTGKTRSHLGIYARRPTRGRLLVVCPKTLMRSAWGEEVATAFPQFGVVYSDAGKQRIEALRSFAEIVVINIDGVKELLANKEALKILSTQFDHLIIDEISYYKHGTSKRTKAMIKLAKLFKWRFGLTGTPTPNSVTELWAPMMIVDGGVRLGTSFFGFRNTMQTATQVGPRSEHVRWDDNPGAANVVFHLINDIAVRHSFEEVMTHVPPNHRSVVQFDLSSKARKAYKQMEDQAEAELDSGTISAVHASSLRTKLLQICSGAVYANPDQYGIVDTQRYELICDLIEERKHSVTFFRWKHQRDQLADMLDKRNVRFAIIDGNTPDREREDIVTAYQAGKYQTILLHPQTGAHGLTLTRGTTTILCSPIYEADLMKQALHRIYRGTQNQVTNTILVCARDTVEEYVYGRLDQKTEHMNDFLEMVRASKDNR